MIVPTAIPGTFRHHGDRVVGFARTTDARPPCTTDSHPLRTFLGDEVENEVAGPAAELGHRETEGACGCKACQQRRRTQDAPIRTIADLNTANRRAFGQK